MQILGLLLRSVILLFGSVKMVGVEKIAGFIMDSKQSKLVWYVIAVTSIVLMANLGAILDSVLHPDIEYFDIEHIVVGGVTAFFAGLLVYLLSRNITYLENVLKDNIDANRAISQSDSFWQSTFDAMGNSVMMIDTDGTILKANKISNSYFETQEEIVGKKYHEVVHNSEFFTDNCPLIRTRLSHQREKMVMEKGGRWFEVVVDPIVKQDNKVEAIVHVVTDITELRSVQEELKQSEEDYRKLFEDHSAVKLILDPQTGKIQDANHAAAKFYGWTRDTLKTMNIFEINTLEKDNLLGKMNRSLSKDQSVFQFKQRRADGSVRDVEVYSASITMGGKTYLHSIVNDITERKKNEEEIKLKTDQLIKLNAQKDKLFSIISHDLRSPFQALLGLTEIIAENTEEFTTEQIKELVQSLHEKTINLSNLLINLLRWAQTQNGTIKCTPVNVSLAEMINETVDSLSLKSLQKQIAVVSRVEKELIVCADRNMIQSVLLNFLSNALKFTNRQGTIQIDADFVSSEQIKVSVQDNGVGISKEDLGRLFQVGEKIGSVGTEGELSTGLGLLLCKEFIELNKGIISAESEEGKGSTFSFTLPACTGNA